MLFQLYEDGHTSAFEILVACLISVRTRDETSLAMARRLFAQARTPTAIAKMDINAIDALIDKCAFHLVKSEQINTLARLIVEENAGELPCSFELMTSYPGIGPKCASLALGIACGQPRIGVDIHVHRITNRWGYVKARTPEQTMTALGAVLPERYHVEINALLVPFGKHICTPVGPKCSSCPLLDMCQQRGVESSR
ncbi:MAG: endonuclease III [Chloroflexi bacterium]|nr:endonuclease III [Chloroflexota bacterium]MBV9132653.1 endonuclease III [Chloroflexota bacterium]MBV9893227.1 endonuclease III [Chloroflexota bacterium]